MPEAGLAHPLRRPPQCHGSRVRGGESGLPRAWVSRARAWGPALNSLLPPQWYVVEKVDLHPQLCFKVPAWATGAGKGVHGAWSLLTCHSWISQFSFGNSSHAECPHRTFGEPISDPGWDPSLTISPSHNCGEAKLYPCPRLLCHLQPSSYNLPQKHHLSPDALPSPPLHSSSILECEHGYPGPAGGPSLLFKDTCHLQCCLEPPRLGAGQRGAPRVQRQPGMA